MEINNNLSAYQANIQYKAKFSYQELQKENDSLKENASKIDGDLLMQQYTMEFQLDIKVNVAANSSAQGAFWEYDEDAVRGILGQYDFSSIGYDGTPLDELTSEEAAELVSEDGFFGVDQTAERIANFVIMGAGDDVEKLKAGREGIQQGFDEAEELFGGTLPDIAHTTIGKALEIIDKRFAELGIPVLDAEA